MAHPNRHGGHKPPSVIAAQPVTRPEVQVTPAALAVPLPPPAEPVRGDVELEGEAAAGGVSLDDIKDDMQRFAAAVLDEPAQLPKVIAVEPAMPERPKPVHYVAACCIFVGGAKGRVEPGEPYIPASDAERIRYLAEGVIRPV